jgi:2-dehydro-3-deoxyphosphogluconate aldolase/(4S)-4-hydroxy-2-oxoglutarate aldolase
MEAVMTDTFQKRIVPVVVLDRVEDAVSVAQSLLAGGLDVIEVTFRTEAAAECIRKIKSEVPAMIVGAGTILSVEHARRAAELGVAFGVAPGLNPAVVREANANKLPFFPGVMTPSEVETAFGLGCRILKFFPAEQAGGAAMVKALAAPYRHLGIRFIPTGGVSMKNLKDYLALPEVAAVGGTWLATRETIQARDWGRIEALSREALAAAQGVG